MKTILKVAAVFIGTIVGAGLASGQEILVFFSKFGIPSFYGLLVCSLLYIVFSIIIVKFCYNNHFSSYKAIIGYIFGGKFGKILDYLTTFFIFAGNVVMLSGSGAMLHEYFNIPNYFGILIMASVSFLIILNSTKGLIAVNSIIVPLSSSIILILGILTFLSFTENHFTALYTGTTTVQGFMWLPSSIIYASFNLLTVTGVLCPMINEISNRIEFTYGVVLGSIVLLLLSLSINFAILYYAPESFKYEIPNLYISRFYNQLLPLLLSIIIWFEMLSTEISELYSISKAFQSTKKISYFKAVGFIILISIPLSFIGFSKLISLLYPLSGIVGLIFIIGCLHKYLKLFSH